MRRGRRTCLRAVFFEQCTAALLACARRTRVVFERALLPEREAVMAPRRENVFFAATRLCGRPCSNALEERPASVSIPHLFKTAPNPRGMLQRTPGGTSEPSEAPVTCMLPWERRQPIAFAERLRRDVVPCTLSDGRIRAASAARCRNRSPETRCAALSTKTCKRLPKRCCNSDARGLIAASTT